MPTTVHVADACAVLGCVLGIRPCCRSHSPIKTLRNFWRWVVSRVSVAAAIMFPLLAMLPTANTQSVTGQIAGTVVDAAGAIVAGASVRLTHDLSQQVHQFVT